MSRFATLAKLFRRTLPLVALSFAAASFAPPADAAPAKKDKKPKIDASVPAPLEAVPGLRPKSLRFGMSPKEVAVVYARLIDEDYKQQLQEAEPGIQMQRIENEIEEKKAEMREVVDFGETPTSYDGSNIDGEYSYKNGEAVMQVERQGKRRFLFFIRNKLWKIIDEYKLGPKAKFGADFKAATEQIEKDLDAPGRPLAAAPDAGRRFDEVDYADALTHLRLINWSNKLAIAYVDRKTEDKLPELRKNKPKAEGLDPAVRDVLRK